MTLTSFAAAANYVADAVTTAEAATVPFAPEKVDFGTYGFLAWVRTGVTAAAITPATGTATRATLTATVPVVPDVGAPQPVDRTVALYGPGDVIGFDAAQVIRCYPADGAEVANNGTLAHIEFDDPALPWAFSPTAATAAMLQPWVALVVVDARLATLVEGHSGLPPQLTVPASEIQPCADAWAWAHAQVQGATGATDPTLADRLTDDHGAQNLSRLLCPRRLADHTPYLACVVPTFDVGARAGRGVDGGTLAAAWGSAGTVTLPVYYSWHFATAEAADFEALAKRLLPVVAPARVGRRSIDVSRPGGTMAAAPAEQGAVQMLECALHSPLPLPAGATTDWTPQRTEILRGLVNRGLALQNSDLPRVSPRAYGQFQRSATKLSGGATDWFDQLNTRPLDRLVAGLGTRVVQRDADKLVEAAWVQAAAVETANSVVVEPAQFGRYVAEATVKKGEDRMDLGALASVTQRVQGKLGWGGGRTLAGEIAQSAMPPSATSAAYRRLTAPGSRLARTMTRLTGVAAPMRKANISIGADGMATGLADMRTTYKTPDAVAGLNAASIALLPAQRLQAVFGAGYAARLGNFTTALDQLGGRTANPAATIDLGAIIAAGRLRNVERVLGKSAALTLGMRESLGGVLAAGIGAAAPDISSRMQTRMAELNSAVPEPAPITPIVLAPVDRGRGTISFPPIRGQTFNTVIDPSALAAARGGTIGAIDPRVLANGGRTMPGRDTIPTPTPAPAPAARSAIDRFTAFNAGRAQQPSPRGTVSTAALLATLKDVAKGRIDALPRTPVRKAPAVTRAAILDAIAPRATATRYAQARLRLGSDYANWFADGMLKPLVVQGPRIERPMYEALRDYDPDWLVPGLGAITKTNFVTLLVSNTRFIESFMVGLSDEMSRELLWRHYPTDRRATFFSRFWNADQDELSPDINQWPSSGALGSHLVPKLSAQQQAQGQSGDRVVLLIRGDLVRRIPDAIVTAVQRQGTTFGDPSATGTGSMLFRASLSSDTIVVGFDLTLADIANPAGGLPWWFLISEHPGAPRFGLDTVQQAGPANVVTADPDVLDWWDLPMIGATPAYPQGSILVPGSNGWAPDAARVARTLMQSPARVAYDAKALITAIQNGQN